MWIREREGGWRICPKNRTRGVTNRNLVCGGAQAAGPWSWKDGLHCYELQQEEEPIVQAQVLCPSGHTGWGEKGSDGGSLRIPPPKVESVGL